MRESTLKWEGLWNRFGLSFCHISCKISEQEIFSLRSLSSMPTSPLSTVLNFIQLSSFYVSHNMGGLSYATYMHLAPQSWDLDLRTFLHCKNSVQLTNCVSTYYLNIDMYDDDIVFRPIFRQLLMNSLMEWVQEWASQMTNWWREQVIVW